MGAWAGCPLPRTLWDISKEKEKGAEGMKRKSGGETREDDEEVEKKEKAINLIEGIKIYKELAITEREARVYFGRSVVTGWHHGDEEMVEWSKRKVDHCCGLLTWSFDFVVSALLLAGCQLFSSCRKP